MLTQFINVRVKQKILNIYKKNLVIYLTVKEINSRIQSQLQFKVSCIVSPFL
jgi:hypothetical protein